MVPLEYMKKFKIIVIKQMQFLEYKALNSKFNCNFFKFWNLNPPKTNFEIITMSFFLSKTNKILLVLPIYIISNMKKP